MSIHYVQLQKPGSAPNKRKIFDFDEFDIPSRRLRIRNAVELGDGRTDPDGNVPASDGTEDIKKIFGINYFDIFPRRLHMSNAGELGHDRTDTVENLPVSEETEDIKVPKVVHEDIVTENSGECPICKDPLLFDETSHTFGDCGHVFCAGCVKDWLSFSANSGDAMFPLICPLGGCKTIIVPCEEIKELLHDMDIYSKFEEKHLISTDMAMYCPDKKCSSLIFKTVKGDVAGDCPSCDGKVCFNCKSKDHDGISCEQFQKIPIHLRETEEDVALFETAFNCGWRACPRCTTMIEKEADGCRRVQCRCGYRFCYKCGKQICRCR